MKMNRRSAMVIFHKNHPLFYSNWENLKERLQTNLEKSKYRFMILTEQTVLDPCASAELLPGQYRYDEAAAPPRPFFSFIAAR